MIFHLRFFPEPRIELIFKGIPTVTNAIKTSNISLKYITNPLSKLIQSIAISKPLCTMFVQTIPYHEILSLQQKVNKSKYCFN